MKKKLERDLAKLTALRHYEAQIRTMLEKIRNEALDKLRWYERRDSKMKRRDADQGVPPFFVNA